MAAFGAIIACFSLG